MLQAVGFVAGEAVGDVDHVARFEPARLADHGSEGIRNIFPGDPVVPAEGAAAERVITNLELRFKSQRVAGSHGSILEIGGCGFEGVEVDAVGADFIEDLRELGRGSGGFPGAGIPQEIWEKNFYVVLVKLVDNFFESREAAGKIAEEIELVAFVEAEIGIDVPEKNGIDGSDTIFGFGKKAAPRVFAFLGGENRATP